MTHRIATHNGLSGRYRTMPTDYFDLPDDVDTILAKADKLPNHFPTPENPNTEWDMFSAYYESCERATHNYKLSVEKLKLAEKQQIITNAEFKRAREIIRGQLPTAGMTERLTVMNLRSFANYQKLRNSSHAQPEIRDVAQKMLEQVKQANICPVALAALEASGWQI
jgi:thymidylate synthase ThyX